MTGIMVTAGQSLELGEVYGILYSPPLIPIAIDSLLGGKEYGRQRSTKGNIHHLPADNLSTVC